MSYRSEEDARRARREAVAKELADAKAELAAIGERRDSDRERGEKLGERIAELEREETGLAAAPEPAEPERPAPVPPKPGLIGRVGRVLKILGIAIGIVAVVGWAAVGCVTCVIHETGCRSFDRRVDLHWTASVADATGINLPAGTSCAVSATVWTEPDERRVIAAALEVACAGRTLFESDRGSTSLTLEQEATGSGFRYRLSCNEPADDDENLTFQASRSGPSTSLGRIARPRGWWVNLTFPEWSDAWTGEPAFTPLPPRRDPGFDATVERSGRVGRVDGASPVSVGDACTVRVRPIHAQWDNCRVNVSCATRVLFDAHTTCALAGRRPVRADEPATPEGGPGLDLDLERGTAKVRERGPGIPYSAAIRLDP